MAGKMPEMKLDIRIATALVSAGDSSGRKGARAVASINADQGIH